MIFNNNKKCCLSDVLKQIVKKEKANLCLNVYCFFCVLYRGGRLV